jgi:hypothetical protein
MNLSNPLGAAPIGGLSSAKPAAPKRFLPRFSEHPDARLPYLVAYDREGHGFSRAENPHP